MYYVDFYGFLPFGRKGDVQYYFVVQNGKAITPLLNMNAQEWDDAFQDMEMGEKHE